MLTALSMATDLFTVEDCMNGVLLHADKSETILNIARLMHRNNADAILIRDNGVPVGIITSRELLSGLVNFLSTSKPLLGEHIMRTPLVTVTHNEDISSAWELMRGHDVEHLPVKKDNDIIGLIVERDLIRDLAWYKG